MATPGISVAQFAARVVGIVYLAIAVLGFMYTGFSDFTAVTGDHLFGVFAINPFHNVVHLAVGLYLIMVSFFDTTVAEGALIGGGIVYLVAGILGATNDLQIIGSNSATQPDTFLHFLSGLAAIAIGLTSTILTRESARRSGAQAG